jgi:hypothetical protein
LGELGSGLYGGGGQNGRHTVVGDEVLMRHGRDCGVGGGYLCLPGVCSESSLEGCLEGQVKSSSWMGFYAIVWVSSV